MRSAVAFALLAAGSNAHPMIANIKRAMHGSSGNAPEGNSGYTGSVSSDLKDTCLQAHNDARSAYGYPALVWDDNLASSAAGWADQIGSSLTHSDSNGAYGENLAYNSNGNPRDMILNQWFGECPDYSGGFSEQAGHYSQCVWHSSTHVGCGMNSAKMLVCQYYPAGNVEGEYDQNVPSPGSCVNNIGNIPVGSGGAAPASSGPGYSGSSPSGTSYGSGSSPSHSSPSYGGSSPSSGGHPHHKPAPKPKETPCDEEASKPTHKSHHHRPYGSSDQSPSGSYKAPSSGSYQAPSSGSSPTQQGSYGYPSGSSGQSPEGSKPSYGDHGQAPSESKPSYGSHGQSPSESTPSYGSHDQSPSDSSSYGGHSYDGSSGQSPTGSSSYGDHGYGGSSGQSGASTGGHGGHGGDDCDE